jgi:hypothetical protein
MAGETGTGGTTRLVEMTLESGSAEDEMFCHQDRWQIVDQSEGCQAKVVFLRAWPAKWLLNLGKDSCPQNDSILILLRRTTFSGNYTNKRQNYKLVYTRCQDSGEIEVLDTRSGYGINRGYIGCWSFEYSTGNLEFSDDTQYQYIIRPGQWGYFRVLKHSMRPVEHFHAACMEAGVVDDVLIKFDLSTRHLIFKLLLDPLIKAKNDAEDRKKILASIGSEIFSLRESDRDVNDLAGLMDERGAVHTAACKIVAALERITEIGSYAVPQKPLTSRRPQRS